MSNWIDHVKKFAKMHNLTYGEALKRASETYDKPKKSVSKNKKDSGGAIKVVDQSKNTSAPVVKVSKSKLVKKSLTQREGRALILKVLPTTILNSPSVLKLLKKFDNDANFRNNILSLNQSAFTEVVLNEVFKNFKLAASKIDEWQTSLKNSLKKFPKMSTEMTQKQRDTVDAIRSEMKTVKSYRKDIAKEVAVLAAVDSNIAADAVTTDILTTDTDPIKRVVHKLQQDGTDGTADLKKYYQHLHKTHSSDMRKNDKTLADVATEVLMLQKQLGSAAKDGHPDPFIKYMKSLLMDKNIVYANYRNATAANMKKRTELDDAVHKYEMAFRKKMEHTYEDMKEIVDLFKKNTKKNVVTTTDKTVRNPSTMSESEMNLLKLQLLSDAEKFVSEYKEEDPVVDEEVEDGVAVHQPLPTPAPLVPPPAPFTPAPKKASVPAPEPAFTGSSDIEDDDDGFTLKSTTTPGLRRRARTSHVLSPELRSVVTPVPKNKPVPQPKPERGLLGSIADTISSSLNSIIGESQPKLKGEGMTYKFLKNKKQKAVKGGKKSPKMTIFRK